tara:strand:- start:267 stop:533 length:267 start_codon:yes stop_codon:yes gene_type:complete
MSLEEVLLSIDFSLERIADSLEFMHRDKTVKTEEKLPEKVAIISGIEHRGRPHGLIPHCTRCRAPHRMRHPKRNNRCIECEFQEEWDE